jgi:hypothetical protein
MSRHVWKHELESAIPLLKGAVAMYSNKWLLYVAVTLTVVPSLNCALDLKVRPLTPEVTTKADDDLSPDDYWDLIEETVQPPGAPDPVGKNSHWWFMSALPANGFAYVYGGKTAYKVRRGPSRAFRIGRSSWRGKPCRALSSNAHPAMSMYRHTPAGIRTAPSAC